MLELRPESVVNLHKQHAALVSGGSGYYSGKSGEKNRRTADLQFPAQAVDGERKGQRSEHGAAVAGCFPIARRVRGVAVWRSLKSFSPVPLGRFRYSMPGRRLLELSFIKWLESGGPRRRLRGIQQIHAQRSQCSFIRRV